MRALPRRLRSLAVSGTMQGTIDFGQGPLTSAGGADLFVAKLPP